MKTVKEIIKQKPVFLHIWEDGKQEDVLSSFEEDAFEGKVLFASYGDGNYEGEAFVLFEEDGKLFEVNGGHCSCYGLEGQWEPEEVDLEALRHRIVNGSLGLNDYTGINFRDELVEFLGIEENGSDE